MRSITETVLEMHYHRPLMDLFRDTFGIGPTGSISFYKYSQRLERFIGFDQAYVKTDMSQQAFFKLLADVAANKIQLQDKFVGYFLQFKVMRRMQNKCRNTPSQIKNTPHYRTSSALDTTKDDRVGLSQHELLYNLSMNNGAMVYYACPMLFDRSQLYEVTVDLETSLRLAEVRSSGSPYTDNENHYIYFNDVGAKPVWCSDPVDGEAISPKQLAHALRARFEQLSSPESASQVLAFLANMRVSASDATAPDILSMVEESFTVVRVRSKSD